MAGPKIFSCSEAGRVQPDQENAPSYDPINRLLYRLSSDTDVLWHEAHFREMLIKAEERGACPWYVLSDSRYSLPLHKLMPNRDLCFRFPKNLRRTLILTEHGF